MDNKKLKSALVILTLSASAAFTLSGKEVKASVAQWHPFRNQWFATDHNGNLATGWHIQGNTWYYLDYITGFMHTGWMKENNTWYYLKPSGAMATHWEKVNNTWYLFQDNGIMRTGWANWYGTWYYLRDSGAMATGWMKENSTWYYLRNSGAMATGWVSWNGQWYYLKNNGIMATGWIKGNNRWFYLRDSGAMATGWVNDKNRWYYLDQGGAMTTGWVNDKNKWYYLDNGGSMVTGWVQMYGHWFYLKEGGDMATGWITYKENKFYLKEDGAMATGILELNGATYYLDEGGALQVDTWIDGKYYDKDGKYNDTKRYVEDSFEVFNMPEVSHIEKIKQADTTIKVPIKEMQKHIFCSFCDEDITSLEDKQAHLATHTDAEVTPTLVEKEVEVITGYEEQVVLGEVKEVRVIDVPAFSYKNYLGSHYKDSTEAHEHTWMETFKTVHHKEEGHWDDNAIIKEAWFEEIEVEEQYSYQTCNYDHEDLTSMYDTVEEKEDAIDRHMKNHWLNDNLGFLPGWSTQYGIRKVKKQILHPAEYGRKWVVDKAAYDKQVVDGYRCECEKKITLEEKKQYQSFLPVEKEVTYTLESHIGEDGTKVIDKSETKKFVVGAYSTTTEDMVGSITKEEVAAIKAGDTSNTLK